MIQNSKILENYLMTEKVIINSRYDDLRELDRRNELREINEENSRSM